MADVELPVLEPPSGGLAKLRARIADDDRRRVRWQWLAVPVLAAAAIALWLVVARSPAPPPRSPAATLLPDPSMMGVAFYWVTPSPARPPRASSPAFVDISAVSITP